jgi:hypothetical protein
MGAVVVFADASGDRAAVYLHGDDGDVPDQLEEFFRHEDEVMRLNPRYDNRFHDPQYLAARFVEYNFGPTGRGVGVTVPSERDNANYRLLCTQASWPTVVTL